MPKSNKIADVQVGRVVDIAATETKKATTIKVTDVVRFRNDLKLFGVKLTAAGKVHPRGTVHEYDIEKGRFIVSWCDEAVAETVTSAPVEVSFE